MRTIIDIPDSQVKILNQISQSKHISRASIIREAINKYINNYDFTKKGFQSAFGIWKNESIDGIEYQGNLRAEWDDA